jgi:hypothetical protein
MDNNKLILLIDNALLEINNFAAKSKVYSTDKKPISDFKGVLDLLKLEIQNNPTRINERVLRATRDVSGIIARQFEETSLAEPFYEVIDLLYEEIPHYKKLEPLRMDFGKDEPI